MNLAPSFLKGQPKTDIWSSRMANFLNLLQKINLDTKQVSSLEKHHEFSQYIIHVLNTINDIYSGVLDRIGTQIDYKKVYPELERTIVRGISTGTSTSIEAKKITFDELVEHVIKCVSICTVEKGSFMELSSEEYTKSNNMISRGGIKNQKNYVTIREQAAKDAYEALFYIDKALAETKTAIKDYIKTKNLSTNIDNYTGRRKKLFFELLKDCICKKAKENETLYINGKSRDDERSLTDYNKDTYITKLLHTGLPKTANIREIEYNYSKHSSISKPQLLELAYKLTSRNNPSKEDTEHISRKLMDKVHRAIEISKELIVVNKNIENLVQLKKKTESTMETISSGGGGKLTKNKKDKNKTKKDNDKKDKNKTKKDKNKTKKDKNKTKKDKNKNKTKTKVK